jgi:hypothetical protein
MKNIYEVLRQKEIELSSLKKEIEALRIAAPLLSEGEEADNDNEPKLVVNASRKPITVAGKTEQSRWP